MHSDLIEKHNAVIGDQDTWHCVGDFSGGNLKDQKIFLNSLNGKKKILYLGNHDRTKTAMLKIGFDEVYTYPRDWYYKGLCFRISHYPFLSSDNVGVNKPRFYTRRPSSKGCDWLICGHVHTCWKIIRKSINVGVDVHNFSPISIEDILNLIEGQGFNIKSQSKL